MRIENEYLTEAHIGRKVVYRSAHGAEEIGELSSFSESGIWIRFRGPQGERCNALDLRWHKGEEGEE